MMIHAEAAVTCYHLFRLPFLQIIPKDVFLRNVKKGVTEFA
jgi:hypothetical protein